MNRCARPDRDSVDRRVVSDVRNRTGKIINCVFSERHHALQQEKQWLVGNGSESSQTVAPTNQQSRELAEFNG